MGDCINAGKLARKNIFASISTVLTAKETQTEAAEAHFKYSPYKNGARNAPARAPQEIPIS